MEEKQEEKTFSQAVRDGGLAGCESFSGTNTEQAISLFRVEGVR